MKQTWYMKKPAQIAAVVVIIAVCASVVLMLRNDSKAAEFSIENRQLEIKTSFGVTVPLDEINGLTLTETMPAVVTKTNGAGVGSVYKGEFTLEGDVKSRLYVDAKSPPFISFEKNGIMFYLNSATAEETQALYDKLQTAVGN